MHRADDELYSSESEAVERRHRGALTGLPDSTLVRRVRHSLAQGLFTDEKAQAELSLIGIAVKDGIELLAAECADDLPFVVGIEHALETLTGNLSAIFTVQVQQRGFRNQIQLVFVADERVSH